MNSDKEREIVLPMDYELEDLYEIDDIVKDKDVSIEEVKIVIEKK